MDYQDDNGSQHFGSLSILYFDAILLIISMLSDSDLIRFSYSSRQIKNFCETNCYVVKRLLLIRLNKFQKELCKKLYYYQRPELTKSVIESDLSIKQMQLYLKFIEIFYYCNRPELTMYVVRAGLTDDQIIFYFELIKEFYYRDRPELTMDVVNAKLTIKQQIMYIDLIKDFYYCQRPELIMDIIHDGIDDGIDEDDEPMPILI